MKSKVLTAFGGLLLSAFAVQAQNSASQHLDNGAKKMMTSADMAFAMKAAQGGLAEVKLGQLAAEKANNPDVKAFGERMVTDHTKANDELKSIATAKSATLPSDINAKDQSEYNKLSQLSGSAFDSAYVKAMVKDHEEDVKEFQKEADKGKDPEVKAFASRTLPVLQSHLDGVKSIQSKMGQ
jgi:putative membrane protein